VTEQPTPPPSPDSSALVVGASGITGTALVDRLTAGGWDVAGLSRRPVPGSPARHVAADLRSAGSLADALRAERPTHVFFCAWSRQQTEAENIVVNRAMVADLLAALAPGRSVAHVALVTGLKHYLGPFEAYGKGDLPETPFTEDTPRRDTPNFYYAQEDELIAAAGRYGFGWSVHRAHTMIGYAVGNAMNIASTLAAYAALCRETGRSFRFPGSAQQWHGLTDMTDAGQLADQMTWAATTPGARDEPFNTVNGDVFRWRWMWPRLAELLDVTPEGFDGEVVPLEQQTEGMAPVWERIAERERLRESQLDRVASFWHTDGDLGRDIECVTDMTKSRLAGFTGYVRTLDAFARIFDRLREERVVPA
jgi:nucleoside-diphosphate-sugar epimerase